LAIHVDFSELAKLSKTSVVDQNVNGQFSRIDFADQVDCRVINGVSTFVDKYLEIASRSRTTRWLKDQGHRTDLTLQIRDRRDVDISTEEEQAAYENLPDCGTNWSLTSANTLFDYF
jgi:hypothetical protein